MSDIQAPANPLATTTRPNWYISNPAHGVFLMHETYCALRLDKTDPSELTRAWNAWTRGASKATRRELEKALVAILEAHMEVDVRRKRGAPMLSADRLVDALNNAKRLISS